MTLKSIKVGIIEAGVGNSRSVARSVRNIGHDSLMVKQASSLKDIDCLIIPGVGSFDGVMSNINEKALSATIRAIAREGLPILGICVGMQILMENSEEGILEGLGIIPGVCQKIVPSKNNFRVPNIGWNEVRSDSNWDLLRGIESQVFYFNHSFVVSPTLESSIRLEMDYGTSLTVGIQSKNVYGVQFHPEKSGNNGEKLLENFISKSINIL